MADKVEEGKLLSGFRSYIRPKRVLIADENATTRTNIARCLVELGAIHNNIDISSTAAQAIEELQRHEHKIIICEYDLGNRCGLDLLQSQKELIADTKDCLFVLVTANTSQSAVAQAAEEDVDTYIIKPFSSLSFRERLLNAATEKLFPSEYMQKIMQGKEFMFDGKLDHALVEFEDALKLDDSPTLAYFYIGQTNTMIEQLKPAESSYKQGLSLNRIHYKCLVGLFELLMAQEQFDEAYSVVQRIANYFPANPKRLGTVLRLAILTKNYTDIERYYQTFINLDQRNPELVRYICAGLIICGKFYLQQKQHSRAVELFKKATNSSMKDPKLMKEVIASLFCYQQYDNAVKFMRDFPPEARGSEEYRVVEFINSSDVRRNSQVVEMGRELIEQSKKPDITVCKIVLLKMIEMSNLDNAELYLNSLKANHPDLARELDRFWKIRKLNSWDPT